MITQDDLKKIEELFKRLIIQGVWHLVTKEDIKPLATSDQISHLPTKEEFFKRMDTLSGEVKAMRETQELHASDHSEANDRLDVIEKHLKITPRVSL